MDALALWDLEVLALPLNEIVVQLRVELLTVLGLFLRKYQREVGTSVPLEKREDIVTQTHLHGLQDGLAGDVLEDVRGDVETKDGGQRPQNRQDSNLKRRRRALNQSTALEKWTNKLGCTRKSSKAPSSLTLPFLNSSSGRGNNLTSVGTSVEKTTGIPLTTPSILHNLLTLLASGSSCVRLKSAICTRVGSHFAPAPMLENTLSEFLWQCVSSWAFVVRLSMASTTQSAPWRRASPSGPARQRPTLTSIVAHGATFSRYFFVAMTLGVPTSASVAQAEKRGARASVQTS